MHDVEPHLYTTVIREMIRHENDVTNHRIMWLLIVQGLIANAYVSAGKDNARVGLTWAPVGILVTLSAFVMLYKSYHARGYLQFLGTQAKLGTLHEQDLPLFGWPGKRVRGWRDGVWFCPWLSRVSELLEPYFFLPALLVWAWLSVLLRTLFKWQAGTILVLAALLGGVLLSVLCMFWVWIEQKDEIAPRDERLPAKAHAPLLDGESVGQQIRRQP